MAYLRDLKNPCSYCKRTATKELINQYNASCGKFCALCAKAELKRLQRSEKTPLKPNANVTAVEGDY